MFAAIVGCEFHGRQEEVGDHQGRCGYRGLPKAISQKDFKDQVSSALQPGQVTSRFYSCFLNFLAKKNTCIILRLFPNQGLGPDE